VKIAIFTLIVTQLLNLVFIGPLAHAGLALAISAGACINAGLLFYQCASSRCFSRSRAGACCPQAIGGCRNDVGGAARPDALHARLDQGHMLERFLRLGVLVVGVVVYFGMLLLQGFRLRDFNRKSLG
jgi:putative peptidoglycan lipid II flippase